MVSRDVMQFLRTTGATLDGVTRPTGALVPRVRQAPDGGQSGGSQPTDISVITRRILLAPALPMNHLAKKTAPCRICRENFYASS